MSHALAPLGAALPAARGARLMPSGRFRTGAGLQTSAGSVSAFFSLEHFDRRRKVATYVLRVINHTKSALICRTWVLLRSGEAVLAYPTLFEVEAFTTSSTQVPVWPGDFPSFERAIAEVAGNGVHCLVEAPAPQIGKPGRTYAIVAAANLALGLLAIAAAGLLHAAQPRIAALALPPQALAGTTVQAEYSVFGTGRLSYVVTAPDGHRLQGGPLEDRTGTLFVAIPAASEPGAYVLRMRMDGPLGSASDTRVLTAAASRSAAQIQDISVDPTVAEPGQTITVAYAAVATGGYVRLTGTDGTIWAQKPFSRRGETSLVVPPLGDGREMRVLLHVTKGKSTAQSVAGILVASPARASAAGEVQVAGDDNPNAAAAAGADANGTFEVTTRTVASGGAIAVRILSPRNGMRIALTDTHSREIRATDVGVDSDVVTLRAPSVSVATRFTIVASFTDGFGQESIVQPVTVLP